MHTRLAPILAGRHPSCLPACAAYGFARSASSKRAKMAALCREFCEVVATRHPTHDLPRGGIVARFDGVGSAKLSACRSLVVGRERAVPTFRCLLRGEITGALG